MPFLAAIILLALLNALAVTADGAPTPKDLVKAELVTDVASVKPGQPFRAGVLLSIKPDWHVYWKNPGDSGLPTRVKWNLPEGWKAGELQFPIPSRFDQPGDVAGYGYHHEVMLVTTITPPDNGPAGTPVELTADVSWLVCEKICVPGKATVKTSLPVGTSATPAKQADAERFAKWSERLPKPATSKGEITAGSGKGAAKVSLALPPGAKDVQWFAVPPEGTSLENVQTQSSGAVSTMAFALVPPPAQPGGAMEFLVAYSDEKGKRQGVEFTVNLPTSPAGK